MLTDHEQRFLVYWEQHRERERRSWRQLLIGLPIGLLFSIPILVSFFSGRFWYKRAEMVGNSQTSPVVMIVAILLIAAFVAVFYKKHQFDKKEQRYQEILLKKKRGEPSASSEIEQNDVS